MKRFIGLTWVLLLVGCQTPTRTTPTPVDTTQPDRASRPIPVIEPPQAKPTPTPPPTKPVQRVEPTGHLNLALLANVDQAIEEAITQKKTPGGVLWIERKGQVYRKAFGRRAVVPKTESTTQDTIYDLASLTKVIATAPAIAKLHELGKLDINAPVARYLPDFAANEKESVTVRHLLTHSSGLRPGLSLSPDWVGNEHAIKLACAESLRTPPGTQFKYSDINFILLGEIVHRVSGQPLHRFVQEYLYQPLGMNDTGFLPRSNTHSKVAPTTADDTEVIRGIVHDPTSRRMGGVAGHAGLFSTASDLARFARMLLNQGAANQKAILAPETVKAMTANQSPEAVTHQRGWGWDIASPYSSPRGHRFELGSYGHTGWTGTSIWIDPFSETFVIFLSNRNHPTEDGNVIALRRTIGTLAADAVLGYTFPKKSTAKPASKPTPNTKVSVLNGIDQLKRTQFKALAGQSIGLITNHTGRSIEQETTIDLLHQAANVNLVALFSPEHGIRGKEDSKVNDSKDTKTGLPIFSLYGKTRKPTAEQLQGIDTLVFDIQDIGCRFYTYISTMGLAMNAAAEHNLRFVVLDRINPIAGDRVEGPMLTGETSFVGYHPMPIRHGMTVGELAKLFADEQKLTLDLDIIPLANWQRGMWLDETEIPWINPSPNMRSLTEAAFYPGIGLLEMADISVGRGTATPFEVIGAPYIDAKALAARVQALALPGLAVEPHTYTPSARVFANETCHGLKLGIRDRAVFTPITLGLHLAKILHDMYPSRFDLDRVNRLLVNGDVIDQIRSGRSINEIVASGKAAHDAFLKRRQPHLLYQ